MFVAKTFAFATPSFLDETPARFIEDGFATLRHGVSTGSGSDRVRYDNKIEYREPYPVATAPGTDLIRQIRALSKSGQPSQLHRDQVLVGNQKEKRTCH